MPANFGAGWPGFWMVLGALFVLLGLDGVAGALGNKGGLFYGLPFAMWAAAAAIVVGAVLLTLGWRAGGNRPPG